MAPKTTTITIIIPTYRRPLMLERAIRSVLNQTYPHFQVCVYDNASGDETAAVVSRLQREDSRIKYYCHPKNIGSARNFNSGLANVTTPFFSFLCDDDVVLPEFFERALEGFNLFPDAMLWVGADVYTDADKRITVKSWDKKGYCEPPDFLNVLDANGNQPTWATVLFRRDVIDRVGIIDTETGPCGDFDYMLRAFAVCPIVISNTPVAVVLIHDQQWTRTQQNYLFVWPSRLNLMKNVACNEEIPVATRERLHKLLTAGLINSVFFLGLKSNDNKDFTRAREASAILKNFFHLKTRATLLSSLTGFHERSGTAYHLTRVMATALWNIVTGLYKTRTSKDERTEKTKLLELYLPYLEMER